MARPLFVPKDGKPFFDECVLCGKAISSRFAQARVSHGRMHTRRGEAVERQAGGHWLDQRTVFYLAAPTDSAAPRSTEIPE